jgi:diacylglycerol kinase (ATP)
MQSQRFSINRQLKGFRYAFAGIEKFVLHERNAIIHLAATILVVIAALSFGVSVNEAIALVVVIGLVWIAEMFNTCIEKAMNFISVEEHPEIGFIKDVAAGAVLVASITAFIIGLLVFIPKIL